MKKGPHLSKETKSILNHVGILEIYAQLFLYGNVWILLETKIHPVKDFLSERCKCGSRSPKDLNGKCASQLSQGTGSDSVPWRPLGLIYSCSRSLLTSLLSSFTDTDVKLFYTTKAFNTRHLTFLILLYISKLSFLVVVMQSFILFTYNSVHHSILFTSLLYLRPT